MRNNMNASNVVMLLGWLFLTVAFVWPNNKWGGTVAKIAFSALSTGIFLANAIYTFM
jgi:hypothetical protein